MNKLVDPNFKPPVTPEGRAAVVVEQHYLQEKVRRGGETFTEEASNGALSEGCAVPKRIVTLALTIREAEEVLAASLKNFAPLLQESQQLLDKGLSDIRQSRHALLAEVSQMSAALRDIRQFFLGETYETEIKRLHEFVGLAERLMVLKEKGFLDRLADTMLSLHVRKE